MTFVMGCMSLPYSGGIPFLNLGVTMLQFWTTVLRQWGYASVALDHGVIFLYREFIGYIFIPLVMGLYLLTLQSWGYIYLPCGHGVIFLSSGVVEPHV